MLVGEAHILEANSAVPGDKRPHARLVLDLRIAGEDAEHDLDVGDRLLDLAIEHPHEIQGNIELDEHGVDHDEVADGAGTRLHVDDGERHDRGEPQREDHRLSGVEHRERGVGRDRRRLISRHGAVVARGLALLGAEILHGLVVEKRIHRLGIGVGVRLVHLLADGDAPLSGAIGVRHVDRDGDENRERIPPVEVEEQDADHEHELEDGRRELEDDKAHQFLDAVAAALEHARQAAGLALEVKAQRKHVHVLEGRERQAAYGVERHLGEQAVAELRQERHGDAQARVSRDQRERHRQHRDHRGPGRGAPLADRHQRVGRPLEGERHGERHELGGHQEHERHDHAQLEVGARRRPQVRPQPFDGGVERAAARRDRGRAGARQVELGVVQRDWLRGGHARHLWRNEQRSARLKLGGH